MSLLFYFDLPSAINLQRLLADVFVDSGRLSRLFTKLAEWLWISLETKGLLGLPCSLFVNWVVLLVLEARDMVVHLSALTEQKKNPGQVAVTDYFKGKKEFRSSQRGHALFASEVLWNPRKKWRTLGEDPIVAGNAVLLSERIAWAWHQPEGLGCLNYLKLKCQMSSVILSVILW